MPYFKDIHTYLHQSSLLLQAYPSSHITTKYSLPRKPNSKSKTPTTNSSTRMDVDTPPPGTTDSTPQPTSTSRPQREPSATLTLKTYHPESGICLKYKTDKAAEVGRLMAGLGRLAKGEVIELPSAAAATGGEAEAMEKMEVEAGTATVKMEEVERPSAAQTTGATGNNAAAAAGTAGGGGGGKKKKKGKK